MAAAAGATSLLSSFTGDASRLSATALSDIPAGYLGLYRQAATTCPGLDWSVLAAIGKIETDHGRSSLPGVHSGANPAGARGPMQFLTPTFRQVVARHPPPPGGARPPSPYNPHDAIHSAAAYLCDSGARGGRHLHRAVFTYNRASWYVAQVLQQAHTYRSNRPSGPAPGTAAAQAIDYARGQLGLPYIWGGDGPTAGDPGFDCSGLTKAAYAAAGLTLPRTAEQQFARGPHVIKGRRLEPGDLVFYGSIGRIGHVGLYIGGGQMIHAPRRGAPIQISPYRYGGDRYVGATRPAE
ncbi:C40 family peptidase [Streptomyces sp. AN091965]|uniref:C40 family peptidase n=1 Tax=Streptomyces sp. AN091965 TaxID=2927803 RepID=UPI001F60C813|nr:bifunctional lytic transglycosylase/C40 family peptidase [Streptomyces sp. AN091965]MCI3928806.1 bifunctional lytic transglycosylase/C40 family peptidase [Streptomyces sp. AN091965]